jgi:hypothetical protein
MDLTMMERVGDREEIMEGYCSTGQSPQWAVVPVEEEEVVAYPNVYDGRCDDIERGLSLGCCDFYIELWNTMGCPLQCG